MPVVEPPENSFASNNFKNYFHTDLGQQHLYHRRDKIPDKCVNLQYCIRIFCLLLIFVSLISTHRVKYFHTGLRFALCRGLLLITPELEAAASAGSVEDMSVILILPAALSNKH